MSKSRLEAFSDGVFAVALTLLVLGLHLPNIANHSSLSKYALAMAPLVPSSVIFALTFTIICVHWVNHHYLFQHLNGAPVGIVWINNLFLLWLCFMPFPAALLGDHPTDQFPILLYASNQLLAGLTFFTLRSYASKNKLFVDRESAKSMGPRHSMPAVILFTLSILFAFVSVYVSLACFLLVPLLYFTPTMIETRLGMHRIKVKR